MPTLDQSLVVDESIRTMFPDLRIGYIVANHVENSGASEDLRALINARADVVASNFSTDKLLEVDAISAWREAYRMFGAKPKVSKPTAEALIRRVIQGDEVPRISDAVDAYLATELLYMLPIGGYDLDQISGPIRLGHSPGAEPFVPLGPAAEEVTREGEVIYRDDARILTRKWNFRDCDATKIVPQTSRLALFVEAPLAIVPSQLVTDSAIDMAALLQKYCSADVQAFLWEAGNTVQIEL